MLGEWMTVDEVLAEILRDRMFYEDSGGGVTVSGGEPLEQPEFVSELLSACRGREVHTALDTCGHATRATLLAVAPLVDVFLYDIKTLDESLHIRHTGVSNALILENLTALCEVHDNVWIRVPLVPGVNDSPAELEAIARFVSRLRGVRQVNLLPYHELGSHKASGGEHAPDRPAAAPVTDEQLEDAAALFRAVGLCTQVGG
jgi:pyruvate formate lyase activating enzyme